jgi:hypothetical protein
MSLIFKKFWTQLNMSVLFCFLTRNREPAKCIAYALFSSFFFCRSTINTTDSYVSKSHNKNNLLASYRFFCLSFFLFFFFSPLLLSTLTYKINHFSPFFPSLPSCFIKADHLYAKSEKHLWSVFDNRLASIGRLSWWIIWISQFFAVIWSTTKEEEKKIWIFYVDHNDS